jgi:nicotinamidase-related amidase
MALDLQTLVAPEHTALVLQEVQNGVVGSPSALPALADAAAAVDLVGNCARLAHAARAVGVTVLHGTAG